MYSNSSGCDSIVVAFDPITTSLDPNAITLAHAPTITLLVITVSDITVTATATYDVSPTQTCVVVVEELEAPFQLIIDEDAGSYDGRASKLDRGVQQARQVAQAVVQRLTVLGDGDVPDIGFTRYFARRGDYRRLRLMATAVVSALSANSGFDAITITARKINPADPNCPTGFTVFCDPFFDSFADLGNRAAYCTDEVHQSLDNFDYMYRSFPGSGARTVIHEVTHYPSIGGLAQLDGETNHGDFIDEHYGGDAAHRISGLEYARNNADNYAVAMTKWYIRD
ncbi:hypothetical protein AJ80_03088 [Polytolypa hystricis UAMH7299]|uniref:Lysine-specific metallo-endopeptidase domain-containing protein n=1 Tax=Polytolypa hystricis (strain UAMH7299) TaxID=1447883 RepID=A0A2B7YK01_POLH7|nr:hypothetical protein AJ80_03088 [Polytolypa hystricis UAMH7299]